MRREARTKAIYEDQFGFARAVRVGDHVAVSGTAPIAPDGSTAGVGDAGEQTRRCFQIIAEALDAVGATLEHAVRTRMFVTDAQHWPAVAAAHGEVFADRDIRPAATCVIVAGLIDPDWLVEIELDAIVPGPPAITPDGGS